MAVPNGQSLGSLKRLLDFLGHTVEVHECVGSPDE
jgi:hypothetical protein